MNLDIPAAAADLVADLLAHPWGRVSASVYETGRLVSLSPWLVGHSERLRHLLTEQRADGGWGPPHDGYALVPTLSATEALLATLRDPGPYGHAPLERAELEKAAGQGLRALVRWLDGTRARDLPDLPAIEHITPALIGRINGHLAALPGRPGMDPLRPPDGMDDSVLVLIRSALRTGIQLPLKLLHALEIAGEAAGGAVTVRPESNGGIGASPAATAAWLGAAEPAPAHPARRFLEAAVEQHGGPVPCGVPITVFERGWVLSWLIRAGIPVDVPAELVSDLTDSLSLEGTAAAAGLPADADTTSGALYALSLLGAPQPPDMLWAYETSTHFCTWRGEDGLSVSTNSHVLEAFGHYFETHGGNRYRATTEKVSRWLCEQQESYGSWHDRWHASRFYATACCALALDRFGSDEHAASVERAVRWVLTTQRLDGSWGRWGGTAEETAYALQILARPGAMPTESAQRAIALGRDYLLHTRTLGHNPPLWHDKDLYLPISIVQAAMLAALHRTRNRPSVSVQ